MNKKPVVLVVMDGVGKTEKDLGNMVMHAHTPTLDEMIATCPNNVIQAHGTAVGLPSDDDMGNSEVGHNALGCGQIYAQVPSWLMNPSSPAACSPPPSGRS